MIAAFARRNTYPVVDFRVTISLPSLNRSTMLMSSCVQYIEVHEYEYAEAIEELNFAAAICGEFGVALC